MSFLNIALLFGAAAFLAPLIIHLLNRSQYQSMDWGAMHLLESALQDGSRRVEWLEWLLLLVRCLIPILLAFCLARPVLTALKVAGADGDKALTILIDDSLSMVARVDANVDTPLTVAREQTLQLVDAQATSTLALWASGAPARDLIGRTTLSADSLRVQIAELEANAGGMQPIEALLQCARQLAEIPATNKNLVFASDFRRSDWQAIQPAELEALRRQMTASEFPTQLTLLDVAVDRQATSAPANVSLQLVETELVYFQPGAPTTLRISVENHSDAVYESLNVRFSVDGTKAANENIRLAANATSQLAFQCQFPIAGTHVLHFQVEIEDALVPDNQQWLVAQVEPPTEVLLVSQSAEATSFSSASDYIEVALSPFDTLEQNDFRVTRVEADKLKPEQISAPEISRSKRVIVLADARRLSERNASTIEAAVADGAGLMVVPGETMDVPWYNQALYEQAELLPRRFSPQVTATPPLKLLRSTVQFPGLEIFNTTQAGDIYDWEFQAYWPFENRDSDSNQAIDILRFASGDPWLCGQAFGKGTVLQWSGNCSEAYSNMAIRSAFVPFVQQLVRSAAQRGDPTWFAAGEPLILDSAAQANSAIQRVFPIDAKWFRADRRREPEDASPVEQTIPISLATRAPGLYAFTSGEADANPTPFCVSAVPEESLLEPLTTTELDALAEKLGATSVRSAEDFNQQASMRESGQEVWRWLLLCLLGLLFIEIWLWRLHTRGGA